MFLLLVKEQIIDPVELLEIRSELEATILKGRLVLIIDTELIRSDSCDFNFHKI